MADVIISMVADDVASRGVWLGDNGALAGAARGAVLIECSTLTVGWIKELAAAAAAARVRVAGCARDRHQASCGLWRVVFPDWRLGGGARHRPARPLGVGPRIQFTWARPEAVR